MAFKVTVTVSMMLFIAQAANTERLIYSAHTGPNVTQVRQNFDSNAPSKPSKMTSKIPATHKAITPSMPNNFDLDIPFQSIAFGIKNLDELETSASTTLHIPGQAELQVKLDHVKTSFGMQHMRAEIGGNIATITRRGEQFFATLALASGSYRLESDGEGSRLYPHRQIAARTIQHEADYRHAP